MQGSCLHLQPHDEFRQVGLNILNLTVKHLISNVSAIVNYGCIFISVLGVNLFILTCFIFSVFSWFLHTLFNIVSLTFAVYIFCSCDYIHFPTMVIIKILFFSMSKKLNQTGYLCWPTVFAVMFIRHLVEPCYHLVLLIGPYCIVVVDSATPPGKPLSLQPELHCSMFYRLPSVSAVTGPDSR